MICDSVPRATIYRPFYDQALAMFGTLRPALPVIQAVRGIDAILPYKVYRQHNEPAKRLDLSKNTGSFLQELRMFFAGCLEPSLVPPRIVEPKAM